MKNSPPPFTSKLTTISVVERHSTRIVTQSQSASHSQSVRITTRNRLDVHVSISRPSAQSNIECSPTPLPPHNLCFVQRRDYCVPHWQCPPIDPGAQVVVIARCHPSEDTPEARPFRLFSTSWCDYHSIMAHSILGQPLPPKPAVPSPLRTWS